MIINNFIVTYVALMLVSLGLCVPAAIAAWRAASQWKPGIGAQTRDKVEKTVYLVISLLVLGFSLRLFMIPLWFLTLQSMIPYVPGAMCMAGVHLLDSPISFIATTLKFFIPLAYIYWLIVNSLDRRIESQPFMNTKLMLVAPLALMMIAESVLDAQFIHFIRPRIVSCCTSLFDLTSVQAVMIVRNNGILWVWAFYITLAFSMVRNIKAVSAVFSILALVSLVLFLHTRVSPVILDTPFHQCIFCLWQGAPDIAIASAALILGLWLMFVTAIIPDVKNYPQASRFATRLGTWAVSLSLTGSVWITVRAFMLKCLMR